MSELDEASEEMMDLVFFALDYAVDNLRDSEMLTPFVVSHEQSGGKGLKRMVHESNEASVEAALRYLRSGAEGAVRAAAAWDGYVTLDGVRTDAAVVEAYEFGRPGGMALAQRYARNDGQLQVIGNATYLGDVPLT